MVAASSVMRGSRSVVLLVLSVLALTSALPSHAHQQREQAEEYATIVAVGGDGKEPLPGKRTPGVHCELRTDCNACLELSYCLWNKHSRVCGDKKSVASLRRSAQWNYVTTCDFSLPPSQQRKERRDTRHIQSATQAFIDIDQYVTHVDQPDTDLSQDASPLEREEIALLQTLGMTRAEIQHEHDAAGDAQQQSEEESQQTSLIEAEAEAEVEAEADSAHGAEAEAEVDAGAAGVSKAFQVQQLNGAPEHGGVDVWKLASGRSIASSFYGLPIGNIPAHSEVVIEQYQYGTRGDGAALYGYGYVKRGAKFGGWAGKNSCAWFPLQRRVGKHVQDGKKLQALAKHHHKCGNPAGALDESKLFQLPAQISWLSHSQPSAAQSKSSVLLSKECPAFLNWDPLQGKTVGEEVATLHKGAHTGLSVRYLTHDGRMAMIKLPNLMPAGSGFRNFFVSAQCIQRDSPTPSTHALLEHDSKQDTATDTAPSTPPSPAASQPTSILTSATHVSAWEGSADNSLTERVVVEGEAVESLAAVYAHQNDIQFVDSLMEISSDSYTDLDAHGQHEGEGESESAGESESDSEGAAGADSELDETNQLAHAFSGSEEYPSLLQAHTEVTAEAEAEADSQGESESESESEGGAAAAGAVEGELDADSELDETNELAHAFESSEEYPSLLEGEAESESESESDAELEGVDGEDAHVFLQLAGEVDSNLHEEDSV